MTDDSIRKYSSYYRIHSYNIKQVCTQASFMHGSMLAWSDKTAELLLYESTGNTRQSSQILANAAIFIVNSTYEGGIQGIT